jgi:hypothetical protein
LLTACARRTSRIVSTISSSAGLRQALSGPDHTEALEAARALIDKIVITPPADPDEPPDIELIGDLANMLKAGGFQTSPSDEMAVSSQISAMSVSSAKGGLRALPHRR